MEPILTRRQMLMESVLAQTVLAASLFAAAPTPYQPAFFKPEDFALLQSFTETLIPTDDTPGAREARCADFIDFVITSSPPEVQAKWTAGIQVLKSAPMSELMKQVDSNSSLHLMKRLSVYAFYTSKPGTLEALNYKGNSYNATFPACTHPEHQTIA